MPKSDEILEGDLGGKSEVLEMKMVGVGGRAGCHGAQNLAEFGKHPTKFRARRASCQRQGAADLKAAPLPPAPFLQFAVWWTLFWWLGCPK